MKDHVLLLLLTASSMTDLKARYVDNQLVLFCGFLGIMLRIMDHSFDIADIAGGVIAPFLLLFPFYAMRLIGAGDVKLLMAAGVFTGLSGLKESMIPITVVSAVIAAVMVFRKRRTKEIKIPMAVPISIGILWAVI